VPLSMAAPPPRGLAVRGHRPDVPGCRSVRGPDLLRSTEQWPPRGAAPATHQVESHWQKEIAV
jgi:hypothetical protein